jgi:hypothetical protein
MLLLSRAEKRCMAQSYVNCLELLRQREQELNSIHVQMYWQQQSFDLANQFLQQQRDLATMRATLDKASLQQLAANLDELEIALSDECENLVRHIKCLDNPIAFIIRLYQVISLATKIVKL